jgi:hypothetical protein
MILNSPTISGSLTVTGNIIASGSITLSGSVASASYAATASFVALAQSASNAVSAATASFANAFTVASTLTAQTLVVQTITSSVDFVTGSTRFGSSLSTSTHQFTGSLQTTGSNIFSGYSIFSSSINEVARFKSSYANGVYLTFESGSTLIGDIGNSSEVFTGASTLDFGINARGNRKLQLGSFQTITLTITGSNVGVGVITPARPFHVHIGATSYSTPVGISSTVTVLGTNLATYAELQLIGNTAYGAGILLGDTANGQSGSILQFGGTAGEGGRMRFIAGGIETMNLRGGNVGIGTTSPASQATGATSGILDVSAATGGNLVLHRNGSGDTALFSILKASNGTYIDSTGAATAANNAIYFRTNNINADQTSLTTALTIASTGAATFSSSVAATTGILSTTYNGGGTGMLHLTSNGTEGGTITFEKTSGTVQKYKFGLGVTSLFIYNETAGNQPFTLTSGGIIQVGSRNSLQQSNFGYSNSYKTLIIGSTGTDYSTDATTLCFGVDVSGNANGSFSGNGTEYIWRNAGSFKSPNSANNNYNTLLSWNSSGIVTVTTSDYRAKEDLKSFEALPMIKAMKLYDFRWIELQERMHGVLAHELQDIVPYAVIGEKDGGSMQGVDYSKLVPVMLKAIQELKAQNDDLQSQINELKAQ